MEQSIMKKITLHLMLFLFSCLTVQQNTINAMELINNISNDQRASFLCDICNKSFTRKNHLEIHKRCHLKEKPFLCNKCPKTFTAKSGLTRHVYTHTGEKPYACNECDKRFNQKGSLNCHTLRIHPKEKSFTVPLKIYPSHYIPLESLPFEDAHLFPTNTPQLEWNNK